MHLDDLVKWLMTLATKADSDCEAYNVGSDQAIEMGELAKLVAQQFGVASKVPDQIESTVDRYIPSIAKARNKFGLNLTLDLTEAVRKTVNSILLINVISRG